MSECYSGNGLTGLGGGSVSSGSGSGGGGLWGACVESYATPLTAQCGAVPAVAHVRSFGRDLVDGLLESGAAQRPGRSAFISSCASHCGFSKADWERAALVPAFPDGSQAVATRCTDSAAQRRRCPLRCPLRCPRGRPRAPW